MKRLSFGVAILLSLLMISAIAEPQGTSKVLLIANDAKSADIELMLVKEVGVMIDLLQKAGFKVVVASLTGQPIEGPVSKLKTDMKLSEVKIDDYAGVILPCMASAAPTPPIHPELKSLLKQAVAKGKPVAAADSSVGIIAEAGVLNGKRYALFFDATRGIQQARTPLGPDPKFGRSYYIGSGVVQDGNIITSGICPREEALRGVPDGTPELTRAFIEKLRQKGGK